mmetsp:Transcript_3303/g.9187  ORF Transcript_3303/g.9187 Transcript_3303/m.9187 type:complete len:88 (+) Transcript_3303:564-827(+)
MCARAFRQVRTFMAKLQSLLFQPWAIALPMLGSTARGGGALPLLRTLSGPEHVWRVLISEEHAVAADLGLPAAGSDGDDDSDGNGAC